MLNYKNLLIGKERKIYKGNNVKKNVILPGDSSELPDDFLKVIVFIDNAYLIRLKNYFFKGSFRYSLREFIENLARKNNFSILKIYLYDAPPFQSRYPTEKENKMKEDYDRFVSLFRKEDIIVREGRTQRLKVDDSFIYKQKGVDMLLGIDMVGATKEFNLEGVILLSGDSDFVPVVEKLKSLKTKVILWTYFERNRKSPFSRSNYLIESVNEFVKLSKEDFEEVSLKEEK